MVDSLLIELLLNRRNALCLYLDAKVATGYHNAVCVVEDFVDIVHTLLIFNLGDNLYLRFCLVENLLYANHIFFASYKRMCDECYVLLDGELDEFFVFFAQ